VTLPGLLFLLFTSNLLTFGSGRVMVPMLERSLVEDTSALTLEQFLFAFTIGRITPGPANLYVAALGYMLYGPLGAFLAAVVVLAPSYLVIPLHLGYRRLAGSGAMRGFGRGLTGASVGLIFASTVDIGQSTLTSVTAIAVCALTLVLLHALRWNVLVCLAIASAAGVGLHALHLPI
jgi:chromate transporter